MKKFIYDSLASLIFIVILGILAILAPIVCLLIGLIVTAILTSGVINLVFFPLKNIYLRNKKCKHEILSDLADGLKICTTCGTLISVPLKAPHDNTKNSPNI